MVKRPRHEPPLPAATAEEAAAIVAALESFMRDTTRPSGRADDEIDPWRRAAMLEGVSRAEDADVRDPWINT
ncbi:MAG: hypothetical protein ABSG95_05000 [Solirubrobacteraceae bacterium]|jgi:hypothetical protein